MGIAMSGTVAEDTAKPPRDLRGEGRKKRERKATVTQKKSQQKQTNTKKKDQRTVYEKLQKVQKKPLYIQKP